MGNSASHPELRRFFKPRRSHSNEKSPISSISSSSAPHFPLDSDFAANWKAPLVVEVAGETKRVDEFGRVYHDIEGSPYILPTDVAEGDRANFQHQLIKYVRNGNCMVKNLKLEEGIKVLDIGTGTGFWPYDMAKQFPNSQFYGADISFSLWAKVAAKEPNVHIVYGNVLERLPFDDNTFDYVHQRDLTISIPENKWNHVISEISRVTKPGGWIELVESDLFMRDGGESVNRLALGIDASIAARGINTSIGQNIHTIFKNSNLLTVDHGIYKIPIGWGGKLGAASMMIYKEILNSIKVMLAPSLGLSYEEYQAVCREALDEAAAGQTAHWCLRWVIGKKPL